jgi:ABC-type branched-subunit amino acid transport system ATPase component
MSLADDACIIGRGTIVWRGEPEALKADKDLQSRWLGV